MRRRRKARMATVGRQYTPACVREKAGNAAAANESHEWSTW